MKENKKKFDSCVLGKLLLFVCLVFVSEAFTQNLSSQEINQAKAIIDTIIDTDQALRFNIMFGLNVSSRSLDSLEKKLTKDELVKYTSELIQKNKLSKQQKDSLVFLQNKLDSINALRFESFVKKYGYPNSKIASGGDAYGIYAFVLHLLGEKNFNTFLPLFKLEVVKGNLQPGQYAAWYDRNQIVLNKKQLYGEYNKDFPCVDNLKNTNDERKKIGLTLLEQNKCPEEKPNTNKNEHKIAVKAPNVTKFVINNNKGIAHEQDLVVNDYSDTAVLSEDILLYNKGINYLNQNNYKNALKEFEKAITINPTNYGAFFQTGVTHYHLKNYTQANAFYKKALNLKTKHAADIYCSIANVFAKTNSLDSAYYYYSKSIINKPSYWQALFQRGVLSFKLGQLEKALADFDSAIVYNTANKLIFLKRGMVYDELKQTDLAIKDFNSAIKLDSSLVDAYIYKGNSFSIIGEYEKALLEFNMAIKLDPNNHTAWYNRATCKFKLKDFKQAIKDYNMVIQLNKKLTKAFYFKAMSEVELGMFDLACLDFERASDFLDAKEKQKKYCQ